MILWHSNAVALLVPERDLRIVPCVVQDISATLGLDVGSLVDRIASSHPGVGNLKQNQFCRQIRRVVRQRAASVGTEIVKIESEVIFGEKRFTSHEAKFLRLGRVWRRITDGEGRGRFEDRLHLILHSTRSSYAGPDGGSQCVEDPWVAVIALRDENRHTCFDNTCGSNGDRFLSPTWLTGSRIVGQQHSSGNRNGQADGSETY